MLAKVKIKNVFSYIVEGDVGYFKSLLRIRHKNYRFTNAYKQGNWDGYVCFVREGISGPFFPTGFIFAYPSWFKDVELIDERERPKFIEGSFLLEGINLFDYQIEAAKKAVEVGRGIINLATNAGKTEVAISITKYLSNLRTLFITHRQHLLFQTKERFEKRLNEKVGFIGVGLERHLDNRVIVATIQTLYNFYKDRKKWCKDFFKTFDVVFWDEVHHLSSDSWYKVGKLIPSYYRFGLTATVPSSATLEFWRLVALTGGIIYRIGQKALVERGISAKPFIYLIKVEQGTNLMNFQEIYEALIEKSDLRNSLISEIAEFFKDKRKVILVKTIRHGEILKEKLKEGVLLTGKESINERLIMLSLFRKGVIKTLIVTTWFEEGTDIPEIEVFINAAGGLSDKLLIQRLGRAVRKKEKENKVIVIDFFDTEKRYLKRHSKNRVNVYEKEGFEIKIFATKEDFLKSFESG